MKELLARVLVVVAAAGACTTIHERLPTGPDTGEEEAWALIPDAPTSTPTPPPSDDETLPANPGGGGGPAGVDGSCGSPTPPPISRVNVSVLQSQPGRVVLNATPLVGPDGAYCEQVGFTDGRLFCPVRPEGDPDRLACEALRVGRAVDTGRPGPTWSADGRPCQGRRGGASCENHPDNQFLVVAFGEGIFRACVAGDVCGDRTLP